MFSYFRRDCQDKEIRRFSFDIWRQGVHEASWFGQLIHFCTLDWFRGSFVRQCQLKLLTPYFWLMFWFIDCSHQNLPCICPQSYVTWFPDSTRRNDFNAYFDVIFHQLPYFWTCYLVLDFTRWFLEQTKAFQCLIVDIFVFILVHLAAVGKPASHIDKSIFLALSASFSLDGWTVSYDVPSVILDPCGRSVWFFAGYTRLGFLGVEQCWKWFIEFECQV